MYNEKINKNKYLFYIILFLINQKIKAYVKNSRKLSRWFNQGY